MCSEYCVGRSQVESRRGADLGVVFPELVELSIVSPELDVESQDFDPLRSKRLSSRAVIRGGRRGVCIVCWLGSKVAPVTYD